MKALITRCGWEEKNGREYFCNAFMEVSRNQIKQTSIFCGWKFNTIAAVYEHQKGREST